MRSLRYIIFLQKKIYVSCDVHVNEKIMWNWSSIEEIPHEEEKEATPTIIFTLTNASTSTTSHAQPFSPLFDFKDESRSPKIRSLQDIYEATNELHLVRLLADAEDIMLEQAVKNVKWKITMQEEMKVIEKNDTWQFTTFSKGHKSIDVKWVYKKKMNVQDEVERYKAILVVKEYEKKARVCFGNCSSVSD
jgi:Reverse transcriptase (RNA-dependent DNA polymerase)